MHFALTPCKLCNDIGGVLLINTSLYRIVLVQDPIYVGYLCLILNHHVAEMTDLSNAEAHAVFATLLQLEACVRNTLKPDKINLASLGNMVKHLHWHIIPRYQNDQHYPNSIWGAVTNVHYKPSGERLDAQAELIKLIKSQGFS